MDTPKPKRFFSLFTDSLHDVRNLRKLITLSLLTAFVIITERIFSVKIPVSENLNFSVAFIFKSAIGFLFGPVAGILSGIVTDLLGYLINQRGGAFHPGWTVSAALTGFIYGVCLYKRSPYAKTFIIWIALSKLLENMVVNVILTPIWMNGLFGAAGKIFTSVRLYKNLILLPFEILVIFLILKSLSTVLKKININT